MDTRDIIAIIAIAVPSSITLAKWYWEARNMKTTPNPKPEESGTSESLTLLTTAEVVLLLVQFVASLGALAVVGSIPGPLGKLSAVVIAAAIGSCVLSVILFALLAAHRSVLVMNRDLLHGIAGMNTTVIKSLTEAILHTRKPPN